MAYLSEVECSLTPCIKDSHLEVYFIVIRRNLTDKIRSLQTFMTMYTVGVVTTLFISTILIILIIIGCVKIKIGCVKKFPEG